MRRRRKREEEHENHERWAIPYGDLLTLLLAFFVVMYSISSVNAGKYRVLSDSLYAAFRGQPRTLEPIEVGHKRVGSGADINVSIVQQATLKGQPRSMLAPVPLAISTPIPNAPYHDDTPPPGNDSGVRAATGLAHPVDAAQAAQQKAAAVMLKKVADDVVKAMSGLVKKNLVIVKRRQYWIEVEIRTDILFPSGSARLSPGAVDIIRRLAAVLARFPNPIRVEGFTDDVPIRTLQFYSNWELSAARAASVVHVFAERDVASGRLAVVGFGDQHPVASNASVQGRNANRRVSVVILSTAPGSPTDPSWLPSSGNGAIADSSAAPAAGAASANSTPPAASTAVNSTPPAGGTAVNSTPPAGGTAPAASMSPADATAPANSAAAAYGAAPANGTIPAR